MEAKELIQKLKVLLGMAEPPAPATEEASTEPTNEKTELEAAETETTETALEAEQPAEPAETEANPLEKRINDLESKIDDMYGVIQAMVEKQAVEAKQEVPPTTTATPAQFAAQEEQKPMSRADRVLALKNMMKE